MRLFTRFFNRFRPFRRLTAALALLLLLLAGPSQALLRLDFEQQYFVHPGIQTWDFCLLRHEGLYHIYYTGQIEAPPGTATADTLYHATSQDLRRWQLEGPAVTVGPDAWDHRGVWAPDVVRDEAAGVWAMVYTGVDDAMNQRICLATSSDLYTWTPSSANPVIEPDTSAYHWDPAGEWSPFRDPYLFRQDGQWHLLVTAKLAPNNGNDGVLYHGVSDDLVTWTDVGPFFRNDGSTPWKVLESPQYHRIGTRHHLFFGEFDAQGISILSASDPASWTMDDNRIFDQGYAAELDEFDPDTRIFSRIAPFYLPQSEILAYVVRLDTFLTDVDGSNPRLYRPNPLDRDWALHTGSATLGNPTFGDNPLWRGEPSSGMVGNSYFSSKEYYQGPLSFRGSPGAQLGDGVTGVMRSRPFTVSGTRMTLLVGGGDYPATCFVALVREATGEILLQETGGGTDTMTPREWDITNYRWEACRIEIVDLETGPMGYLSVDEITEVLEDTASGVPDAAAGRLRAAPRAAPNPFNPTTRIRFELAAPARARVVIHDLRGRLVWSGAEFAAAAGPQAVTWDGSDRHGRPAPAGTYVYGLELDGRRAASGKLSLVK